MARGSISAGDDSSQRLKSLTVYKSDQLIIKKPFEQVTGDAKPTPAVASARPAPQKPASPQRPAAPAKASTSPVETVYRATFNDGITVTQGTDPTRPRPADDESISSLLLLLMATITAPPRSRHRCRHGVPASARSGDSTAGSRAQPRPPNRPPALLPALLAGRMNHCWPAESRSPRNGTAVDRRQCAPGAHPSRSGRRRRPCPGRRAPDHEFGPRPSTSRPPRPSTRPAAGYASLDGSAAAPVARMTNPDSSVLITPQLRFDQQQGLAYLRGPSSASVIADPEGKRELVQASWTESAQATFVDMDKSPPSPGWCFRVMWTCSIPHPPVQGRPAGHGLRPAGRRTSQERGR